MGVRMTSKEKYINDLWDEIEECQERIGAEYGLETSKLENEHIEKLLDRIEEAQSW